MPKNKEQLTPQELGLEDKEGHILVSEEAEVRAYVEKVFRDRALNPKLSQAGKETLLKAADASSEITGEQWRTEQMERLVKEYEERIEKIQKEQLIPDTEVAQAMAEAENPSHLAANVEGLSKEDRDEILKEGQELATTAFMIEAPRRIEELVKDEGNLKEKFTAEQDAYEKIVQTLSAPRWAVSTEKRWERTLYPEHFAEKNKKNNWTEEEMGEEFFKEQDYQISSLKWTYDTNHIQNNQEILKVVKSDCEELSLKIESIIEALREKDLKWQTAEIEKLKSEPILAKKEPLFGKDKYWIKKNEIENKLHKAKDEQTSTLSVLSGYERMINNAKAIIKNASKLEELLSNLNKLSTKIDELKEIRQNLQSKVDKLKKTS